MNDSHRNIFRERNEVLPARWCVGEVLLRPVHQHVVERATNPGRGVHNHHLLLGLRVIYPDTDGRCDNLFPFQVRVIFFPRKLFFCILRVRIRYSICQVNRLFSDLARVSKFSQIQFIPPSLISIIKLQILLELSQFIFISLDLLEEMISIIHSIEFFLRS